MIMMNNDSNSNSTKLHPAKKVSKRSWSPHQAVLSRRNRFDGDQATLNSALKSGTAMSARSFGNSGHCDDDDDEEDDYLAKSLRSIDESLLTSTSSTSMNHPRSYKNGKPIKYAGRRPFKPTMTMVVKNKDKDKDVNKKKNKQPPTTRPSIVSKAETDRSSAGSKNSTTARSSRPIASSSTSTSSTARIDRDTANARTKSRSKSKSKKRSKSKSKTSASSTKEEKSTSTTNTTTNTNTNTNTNTIPIEMQQKLYRITDPNTSIKEKVELELEFRHGTQQQKELYLKCKQQFDRLRFMQTRAAVEQQKRDEIHANALHEQTKEAEFQNSLEQKRKQKRRLENEKKARELKNKNDARHYKAKAVAKTMGEMKEAALEAATVSVERNQRLKQSKLKAERQRITDFRNNEGKDMTDAQRVLAEALMAQDDVALKVTALDDKEEEDDEEEKARKKAKKKAKKAKKAAKKLKRASKLKKQSSETSKKG